MLEPLRRLLAWLVSTEFLLGLLWATLACIGVALLVMMTTRWGRSRPVEKCLVLSALVHIWLAIFFTTVPVVTVAPPSEEPAIRVVLECEGTPADTNRDAPLAAAKPWENFGGEWALPEVLHRTSADAAPAEPEELFSTEPHESTEPPGKSIADSVAPSQASPHIGQPGSMATFIDPELDSPSAAEVAGAELQSTESKLSPILTKTDAPAVPQAERIAALQPVHRLDGWRATRAVGFEQPPMNVETIAEQPQSPRHPRTQVDYVVPEIYRLRIAPDRARQAERQGASPETEAAVKAALEWLAENQETDGRWEPIKHGGGRETLEAGRDRFGAGSHAETGVTALAILAFAAAGNTHVQGEYQATVDRGLNYLLRAQAADGSLGGRGAMYEFMYCHGMATLTLAELAGMSGDEQLLEPLRRAVDFTIAAQDPVGGGWRYRPGEAGDTSQLGWQLMALKSAELAGVRVPQQTWNGAARYLASVSSGAHGGLAAYRPGERVSRTMTAEALLCRQFLGLHSDSATAREAAAYLLGDLPGKGEANLYYWYYASIAMYQLQGGDWQRWSEALQPSLLASQHRSGPAAGSWDPNTRWDAYGGRVYSTALATLCLQAYYRFLPLDK